jgi:hypothetical protein
MSHPSGTSTKFVNEALATFLSAHMATPVKNLTASVDRGDGLGLLKRLQTMNASVTPADRTRALQQLHKLCMHDKEAIIKFISWFRNQTQVLSNATFKAKDMPSDKELATFCVASVSKSSVQIQEASKAMSVASY